MTTTQRDGLKVLRQTFAVSSETHRQAIDITSQVRDALQGGEVHSGLVIANCLHTTCSVLIAQFRPALLEELACLMGCLVDDRARYKHNDARLSDCERGNATAVDLDGVPGGLQPQSKENLPGAPGNDK